MLLSQISCEAQNNGEKMEEKKETNNPLLCDPVEGFCGVPSDDSLEGDNLKSVNKPIKIVYFTDPICSSCWGIEPQLRKLKLEYGNSFEIEYRMGGLLPDWSYNSGGISKPSDVAHHWDEVSPHYDMPIDGDIWLEDPLNSSYPPSIAFKAAQLQSNEKALLFLREMKEMVFLKKQNIAKWSNLEVAARKVGLDTEQLQKDFEGKAKILFEEDLRFAKENGVRGFPTLFFIDTTGRKEVVYGARPYSFYEAAVLKLDEKAVKNDYDTTWEVLFETHKSLTAREFSELSGVQRTKSEKILDNLVLKGSLEKLTTKNGSIWIKKDAQHQ